MAARLPDRLSRATILLSVILAAILYLFPSPLEFPMDDAYIHFVYAENLSRHGGLFFNTPRETGVGTSSILWVLLMAAGDLSGLPVRIAAKIMGVGSLAALGIGIYSLLRSVYPPRVSLAASLCVVLSGNLLWFALSGMETILFLALGILALLCYRGRRPVLLGILLGLLVLTRQEGIVLGVAIGAIDAWRQKAIKRDLGVAALVCLLVCGPWLAYLWIRTSCLVPTTGIGKRLTNKIAYDHIAESSTSLAWLKGMAWLLYPLLWLSYMVEFVLGGFALPGPSLDINIGLAAFGYRLSIWAIIGLATVIVPLWLISLGRLRKYLKAPGWIMDEKRLPLIILLVWMILHNLSYMIYMPNIGTASRYAALNHVVLWISLVLGIWYIRQRVLRLLPAAGLAAIALANTIYWSRVYEANLEHMVNARIAAAVYLRERVPRDTVCGAVDIGALRYHARRPVIDLAGLIDPEIVKRCLAGKSDQLLVEQGITCLVLPGRAGFTRDGYIDIAAEFGLTRSTLLILQPVEVFHIDRERWLLGFLPVANYQATVAIYDVILTPNSSPGH